MTIIVRRVDLLDGAAAAAAAADKHNVSTEDDYYDVNHNQRWRSPSQSPVHFDLNARGVEGEPRSPSPLSSSNSSCCAESSLFTEGSLSPMLLPTPVTPKSRTTTPPVSPYTFKDPNEMTPTHVRNLVYTASYIHPQPVDIPVVTPRGFDESHKNNKATTANSVAVVRCKTKNKNKKYISSKYASSECDIPNPYPFVHDKYWAQRHRLFKKFDEGIMLDPEGWYSVTPEVIADHVAKTVGEMSTNMLKLSHPYEGIVILDAFCGCGGNAIAFGKLPIHQVSLVVCIDLDRNKLRMAAHNAYLYNIPTDKIVFIEANTCFVMDQCYHDGDLFYNGTPWNCYMSPREQYAGYTIGGLDLLPFHIDLVFMDPPWGGVDYNDLGKNGYDLAKNMKIQYHNPFYPEDSPDGVVDGFSLVKMAASATKSKIVIYDTPRNVNKTSLGQAALNAGYRGNIKLEEHYLNGRLKTVTTYFGKDFGELLRQNLT
jgi:trimethylguanosine synthase